MYGLKNREKVQKLALENENVKRYVTDENIFKVIIDLNRVVNMVVK